MGDFNSYNYSHYTKKDIEKLKELKKYHGWSDIFDVPQILEESGFTDSFQLFFQTNKIDGEKIFPKNTSKYGGRIDFIYFSNSFKKLRVCGSYTYFTKLSDHLPIIADFIYK